MLRSFVINNLFIMSFDSKGGPFLPNHCLRAKLLLPPQLSHPPGLYILSTFCIVEFNSISSVMSSY